VPPQPRYETPIDYFNAVYKQHDRYWWRRPDRYSTDPADHTESIIAHNLLLALDGRKPGRALDIGAGEGTDAIRLALLGYEVDAVEGSEVGAEKTTRFAREMGVRLNVIHADANLYMPRGPYDVVVCNGLLHYIADKPTLVQRLQDATAPDGLNAVSLWSDYSPVPSPHQVVDTYCDAEDGTVRAQYKRWDEVGSWVEHNKLDTGHPSPVAHSHSFIKFITRKQV
jgi:SAM-dependent methyltransferase